MQVSAVTPFADIVDVRMPEAQKPGQCFLVSDVVKKIVVGYPAEQADLKGDNISEFSKGSKRHLLRMLISWVSNACSQQLGVELENPKLKAPSSSEPRASSKPQRRQRTRRWPGVATDLAVFAALHLDPAPQESLISSCIFLSRRGILEQHDLA